MALYRESLKMSFLLKMSLLLKRISLLMNKMSFR